MSSQNYLYRVKNAILLDKCKMVSERIDKQVFSLAKYSENTKLATLFEDIKLGIISIVAPQKINRDESNKKWSEYKNNVSVNFLQDDIYNLAFEYNVINDDKYWDLLNTGIYTTEKNINALVKNIHYYWIDLENFYHKIDILRKLLQELKSDKLIFKWWKENYKFILGDKNKSLVDILTELIQHDYLRISEIYQNRKYLISQSDLISSLIKHKILNYKIANFSNSQQELNDLHNLFISFIEYALQPEKEIYDSRKYSSKLQQYRYNTISDYIIFVEKIGRRLDNTAEKKRLIEYFLEKPSYGDLRFKSWGSLLKPEASKIFTRWLNEKDITFFFTKLIEGNPQGRKDFWIERSHLIDKVTFLIGSNITIDHKDREMLKKMMKDSPDMFIEVGCESCKVLTNVFIMQIHNRVFIEFGEKNNACFIYDKNIFDDKIKYRYTTKHNRYNFKLDYLKEKEIYVEKITHHINWQRKLANIIDNSKEVLIYEN